MPTYTFRCSGCGNVDELLLHMIESDDHQTCKLCGFSMNRDYQADSINVGNKDYAKPIHSDSLAMSPDQVSEHQKLFPDVKIDSECRPVFENFKQHDGYLEKTGFVKHRQKIRKKGRKL